MTHAVIAKSTSSLLITEYGSLVCTLKSPITHHHKNRTVEPRQPTTVYRTSWAPG